MKIFSLKEISDSLPEKILPEITKVDAKFPIKISQYYFNLINWDDFQNDPVFKQCFPAPDEIKQADNSPEDPLWEEKQMPVPNLIHRYQDRVVLLVNNCCAVHCRFCLRKRKWQHGTQRKEITESELLMVCDYLKEHREVREVLVSGGDPLMLSTDKLHNILWQISQIPSIDILRLGTRIPVVMPSRVDNKLVAILSSFAGLWLATHFNHPRELTEESLAACHKLIQKGIPVINQTVLLKGINDNIDILAELFRTLAKNKIKPHYLFHVDPVKGNTHFKTGISKGLEIMKGLRNKISSIATPTFAIDLPEGGGKIPLIPQYETSEGFESIDGRYIKY